MTNTGAARSVNEGRQMLANWIIKRLEHRDTCPTSRVAVSISSETRLASSAASRAAGNSPIRNMTGGLGILLWCLLTGDANPAMQYRDFRFFHFALAHLQGRGHQQIIMEDGTQVMTPSPWTVEGNQDFLPLGVVGELILDKGEAPEAVFGHLYVPLMQGGYDGPCVLLSVNRPGITDVFYPPNNTLEALQSQVVLGEGGYLLARELGLFNGQNSLGTAIIQDGHGAFMAYAMLRANLLAMQQAMKGKTAQEIWEAALYLTRQQCITTIHAPQPGTVPTYTPETLSRIYAPAEQRIIMQLGRDHRCPDFPQLHMLNLAQELSGAVTCVSENHLRLTADPKNQLIAPHVLNRKPLYSTPNIVNFLNWLPEKQKRLLDNFCPGWKSDQTMLANPLLVAKLRLNPTFRKELLKIQREQGAILRKFLAEQKGLKVPKDAIMIVAMRRATAYKLNRLLDVLENGREILNAIAKQHGPLFLLFGGLAPQTDQDSRRALKRLIEAINQIAKDQNPNLQAGFFDDYNEYNSDVVLQGSDIWTMYSNPMTDDPSLSEAFGPSGAKALDLAKLLIGFSDGWAPDINSHGQAVSIAGPNTLVAGVDLGPRLRQLMSYKQNREVTEELARNSFLFHLENAVALLREERNARGKAWMMPSVDRRILAMACGLSTCHPRTLIAAYRAIDQDIRLLQPEPPNEHLGFHTLPETVYTPIVVS